jgi:hypothetical protein
MSFHSMLPFRLSANLGANAEAGNVFIVQAKGRDFEVEARSLIHSVE